MSATLQVRVSEYAMPMTTFCLITVACSGNVDPTAFPKLIYTAQHTKILTRFLPALNGVPAQPPDTYPHHDFEEKKGGSQLEFSRKLGS